MPFPRRFLASLAVALLVAACHDDDRHLSPQTCQLECERAAQCSPPAEGGSCREQCAYPAQQVPPPLSRRYLDAVRRCLAAEPCNQARLGQASETCAHDAALSLEPSKPAEDFCRRALRSDGVCRVTTFASGSCLADVKIYDDEALRRAARCYDDTCAWQARCLEEVFGYPYPYVFPIK